MKKTNKGISSKAQTGKVAAKSGNPGPKAGSSRASKTRSFPVSTKEAPVGAAGLGKSLSPAVSLELVDPAARQVFVAGTFNGWRPEATPLHRTKSGKWIGNLAVTPGRHEYLFVVDGQWLPDPNAKETVQNPFGGMNSVLSVSA